MNSNIQKILDNNANIHTSRGSLATSLILLCIAAVLSLVLAFTQVPANASEVSVLLIMGILIFTAWAAFSFLSRKTMYRHQPSNQKLESHTINIAIDDKEKMQKLLKDGNLSLLNNIRRSSNDALQLHLVITPNNEFAVAQLSVYVPYEYVNASEVVMLTAENAAVFRRHFVNQK